MDGLIVVLKIFFAGMFMVTLSILAFMHGAGTTALLMFA